jgi:glycosyltransferase involved in cell wall biosynthesis
MPAKLSIVIPCYNEQKTLAACVERVMAIADDELQLELLIVDDCSKDRSREIAKQLCERFPSVRLLEHQENQGKGAALHTGFEHATGDFVAIQDADLEYDPQDLKRLIQPLIRGDAEVVLGSRFLSGGSHRVLYFWHYMGNRFLTFLSNMFTDLNLTDMETCYKVFRRDVIQEMSLHEKRFGFEPEVVAKIAQRRLRIIEMGISYYGRTYEEGKKIGVKDGFRALYCIVKYSAHNAPVAIQFLTYLLIGGTCAIVNLIAFLGLYHGLSMGPIPAATIAFVIAGALNYLLCLLVLFRHRARWSGKQEVAMYIAVIMAVLVFDVSVTDMLIGSMPAWAAKSLAALAGLVLNFAGRRWLVFPERKRGPWRPQVVPVQGQISITGSTERSGKRVEADSKQNSYTV